MGFVFLIKGADLLIEGSASLAKKMAVSEIVIGLTVISFGTSAPELVVNVLSSIQGSSDIAFGNVIGSNIVNILLILGVAGLISPIKTQKNTVWREIPFALLAAIVLFVVCNDIFLAKSSLGFMVTRIDGFLLLAFFAFFILYTFAIPKIEMEDTLEVAPRSFAKIVTFITIGLIGLLCGGKLVVDSAVSFAQEFGVSDKLTGLTIVAIGTSLPELVTSAMAAYKGKNDIAIGNVVGSNIFNIFFVLGISAVINPLPFSPVLNIDLLVLIAASICLFFTMFTGKRRTLDRWEAVLFLLSFVVYMGYLIIRQ